MANNHRSLILIRWRSVKALVTPNHIQVVSKIKVLPVPRPKLVPPGWMAPTKIKIQAKRLSKIKDKSDNKDSYHLEIKRSKYVRPSN